MGSDVVSVLPSLEALTCLPTPLLVLTRSLGLQEAGGAPAFSSPAHSGGGAAWPVAEVPCDHGPAALGVRLRAEHLPLLTSALRQSHLWGVPTGQPRPTELGFWKVGPKLLFVCFAKFLG